MSAPSNELLRRSGRRLGSEVKLAGENGTYSGRSNFRLRDEWSAQSSDALNYRILNLSDYLLR